WASSRAGRSPDRRSPSTGDRRSSQQPVATPALLEEPDHLEDEPLVRLLALDAAHPPALLDQAPGARPRLLPRAIDLDPTPVLAPRQVDLPHRLPVVARDDEPGDRRSEVRADHGQPDAG